MDKDDLIILHMLKEGNPIQDIQKKLGISRQSVYYRIQRLKKDVDLTETVTADMEKLGYGTIIACLVKWNYQDYQGIWDFGEKYIKNNPHLCFYFILLGEWDGLAVFACKSQNEYYDKVLHPILTYGGTLIKDWVSIPVTKTVAGRLQLPNNVIESLKKD